MSWQPSQEANFHTASFGLRLTALSHLEQRRDRVVVVDGAVAADQGRPELAMAAVRHGAAHVPFHRDEDPAAVDASVHEGLCRDAHHHLRAADVRIRPREIRRSARDELRHHSHRPVPVGIACVDGDVDVEVEPATPALELAPVEQVGWGAPAVEEADGAVVATRAEQRVEHGPKRREPDAARNNEHVASSRGVHRPGAAVRSTDAEHAPLARGANGLRDRTHRPHGLNEPSPARGIAGDRDRHFAHAKRIEHRELAGREGEARAARGLELERPGVGRLAATASDTIRRRQRGNARCGCLNCHGRRGRGAAALSIATAR